MKVICEKINSCNECPYYWFSGHAAYCNNSDGPEERLENLYIYNTTHPKCPLDNIHIME